MKTVGLFLACLALLLPGCHVAHGPKPRPHDPWVFRSVLDGRPRMISLALHEQMYAAYDAENCGLYKLWKGGLLIEGAPFTGVKNIQPLSWGHVYGLDSLKQPLWLLVKQQEETMLRSQFKGYHLSNSGIRFHYLLLSHEGDSIWVDEAVEVGMPDDSHISLERSFESREIPAHTRLCLLSMGQKIWLHNGNSRQRHVFERVGAVPRPDKAALMQGAGSRGHYWLAKSGCDTCHELEEATIGPAYRQIAGRYQGQAGAMEALVEKVRQGGAGVWGQVPMIPHPHIAPGDVREMLKYILSLAPAARQPARRRRAEVDMEGKKPGFGAPLAGLHPSYELICIRPQSFRPKVASMDFLPDGSLLVATWDSVGGVYKLSGLESNDTSQVQIKRIAAGLAEPLGMKVVDGQIFVMQKHELTQLIDHDGDELIDEYRAVCNAFGVTADFHEFALDLAYKDGYFYTNLSLAMRLMAHERQLPDRGRTIRIAPDGSYEWVNFGLRQPNGLEVGLDGELFATDNQGKWLPANKLIHIQPGVFHGSRAVIGDSLPELKGKPPAVWLPQDEIGNSPGEPLLMKDGPYKGQMIHGEVTHGGIKRVFLEKIRGEYQGCVFRFSQGLEAGIGRMVWGPDGGLYVGGVGMNGNWGWKGRTYGLQKLVYNGKTTFEMLAIRARPGGFSLTFTAPLAPDSGKQPADYLVQQWRYEATENYGGPKLDLETLPVRRLKVSADRKKVDLFIPGLKEGHVVYFRLNEHLRSAAGQTLWAGESWYTLNAIPRTGN